MEISRGQRMAISILAIIDLMLFSQMSTSTLLGMVVSAALLVMGLVSYSRPTSVIGMMLASGSAAASLTQESLTVVGNLFNAAIGLFLPVYLLAWIALSAEEEPRPILVRKGPAILTSIFAIICLFSVGLVGFALGYVAPSVAIGMSTLMEIAIVILAVTIGVTVLTSRNPSPTLTGPLEEEGGTPESVE